MKMKKSTIASIIITAIMLLSILPYPRKSEDNKNIEYINKGITIISIYYNKDMPTSEMQNIINFVRTMPNKYKTTFGEIQIVIEEINSTNEKIVMNSINGERIIEKENLTKENIEKNICEILFYSSPYCINITS